MPIYKGTSSNPIQQVHVGGKECCVFKGDTLVHPSAVMYSTISNNDWTIPPPTFAGTSYNQIYMSLKSALLPRLYGGNYPVEIVSATSITYFKINTNGYYDITWKAKYVYSSGGGYQKLRILRYTANTDRTYYDREATLAESGNILVQQTPVDIGVSVRRTYLNSNNAILVVSSIPSSLVTESNAIATINKVP